MKSVRRKAGWGRFMRRYSQAVFASICFAVLLPLHAAAQEREWQLDAQDEDAYLVFGVPNTADIGISLWCKIGQKTISVFAPVPSNIKSKDAKVALQIGDREYALKPKFNTALNSTTVEAELHPSAEILSAIAAAERIGFQIAGHKSIFPTEGANFLDFKKLCTTAPVSN